MARDPDAPTLVCLTTCRARYGLTPCDLYGLDCITCRNPHYRNAAPMRLYVEDDVAALSRAKALSDAERARYREEHAAELEAERKARIAAELAARRDASKAFVRGFYAAVDSYVPRATPGSGWPVDVLGRVLVMVARSLEPDGIRGPGIVALDLMHAAMAFADMREAAADGFAELGRLCPGIGFGFDFRDPMAAKARDLQDCACVLGLRASGSKAELTRRILEELGLDAPPLACVPLSVIRAVAEERRPAFLPAELRRADLDAPEARSAVTAAAGLGNVRGLRAARRSLATRWRSMREFDAEPRRTRAPPNPPARLHFAGEHACPCGQAAAGACSKGLCGRCCAGTAGGCARHRVVA